MTIISASRYHDFSAGHRVTGHENKCAHLHGHNYRVHFTVRPRGGSDLTVLRVDRGVVRLDVAALTEQFDTRLRADQACGIWQTQFKGPVAPGDKIVVCVPRPRAHCRAD